VSLVLAHGFVGRQDLPIPAWLFGWGAAVVLVVSFVALATLWPKPRLQEEGGRALFRIPGAVDVVCGALGVGLFVLAVLAGLLGEQTATDNLIPALTFIVLWVVVPTLSFFLGDVFRAFNPWLAVARFASWAARGRGSQPMPYPERLGRWPAVLGILAFTYVELINADVRESPRALAILALVYFAVQLVGMALFGIEKWSRNGDAFGVTFRFYGAIAPLHRREDGRLALRRPLSGLSRIEPAAATGALMLTLIGTTSFDGFSQGQLWTGVDGLAPQLQDAFVSLGLSQQAALEAAFVVGMLGVTLLVAGLYRVGVLGMQTVDPSKKARDLSLEFAPTLAPIALAYVLAHYFSLMAYEGQRMAYLASDPFGTGADVFGTADATVDYGVIGANGIWYVQVGALVVGHVMALVLAHDRALVSFQRVRDATRSQWWMLAVMVGFTSLGLWLLSAASR
jgi:hypothetical protein